MVRPQVHRCLHPLLVALVSERKSGGSEGAVNKLNACDAHIARFFIIIENSKLADSKFIGNSRHSCRHLSLVAFMC